MNRVLMPAHAYRRTWLVDRLDDLCGRGLFGALLRELAPAEYARVADAGPNRHAFELLRVLNNEYFPIDSASAIMIEDTEYESGWEALLGMGIPVAVFGFDGENDAEAEDAHICLAMGRGPVQDDFKDALEKYAAECVGVIGKAPQCPRGRRWVEPWDAVGLLFAWVRGDTGIRWLDYNVEMVEVGGCPAWNMDEIRALAADWKRHQASVERLGALRELLRVQPAQNLRRLAGALAGDKQVLQRITRPARRSAKPLAEVLRWKN